ncbi:acyltransferase family protein [Desulforamulus reducens]|nr:acyltransferase [Desulforamulus reducens]
MEKKMEDNRLTWQLTITSFILSVLIIFHHCFNIDVDYDAIVGQGVYRVAYVIERYMYNISECAVPIFFFISAFLFFKTYKQSVNYYVYKLKKRLFSLLIPYILYNILGYYKYILFNNITFNFNELIVSIISSSTMPLWFIRELMILSILSPLIYWVINRKYVSIIVLGITALLSIFGVASYRCFIYWTSIYLFGAYVAVYYGTFNFFSLRNNKKKIVVPLSCILFLCSAWFLPNTTGDMDIYGELAFYLFRLICPFIMLLLCSYDSSKIQVKFYMRYSFFTYCVHMPLISVVQYVTSRVVFADSWLLIAEYMLTPFVILTIIVCAATLLSKYFPHIWKVCNGWR